MSSLRTVVIAAVFAFALTTSFLIVFVAVPETVSAYTVHDPIYIEGDAEFTSANGVTGGSGTTSDPYIIEGWDIDASSTHGIWIEDTSAHFTIRDCYIHDGGTDWCGIYLLCCVNGTVTGNNCANNHNGIRLASSSNNTLSGNTCSLSKWDGIYLFSSSDNTLSDNNCSLSDYQGMYLDSWSNNNTLHAQRLYYFY